MNKIIVHARIFNFFFVVPFSLQMFELLNETRTNNNNKINAKVPGETEE